MSYTTHWTHQDAQGHVNAGDWIAAADVSELGPAINRRLKIHYNPGGVWPMSTAVAPGDWAEASPLIAARSAIEALVPAGAYFLHAGGWGQLSTLTYWLYPEAGADEDKLIVRDSKPPDAGEVGFFAKLNGGSGWTGSLTGQAIRAVHVNEPRDAIRLLRRGRFKLRVSDGGDAKASRSLPGGLWYPPAVARDDEDEMHSWFGGRTWLFASDGAGGSFGLRTANVTVRDTSVMRFKPVGSDVKAKLYHCMRNVNTSSFSWTEYDAAAQLSWSSPGGVGGADSAHLVDLDLTNNTWTEFSGSTLTALLQDMVDASAEPTFMMTPDEETGWGDDPTHIEVELTLDFELDGPPA